METNDLIFYIALMAFATLLTWGQGWLRKK